MLRHAFSRKPMDVQASHCGPRGKACLSFGRGEMPTDASVDPCEYNPEEKRAAYEHEVHASAVWIIGANGQWRLCDSCAALPEFKRFKKRKRI